MSDDEQLYCAVADCGNIIVGRGVLMWDPTSDIDWEQEGVENVIHTYDQNQGEERQALALHATCFASFFEQAMRREDGLVLMLVAGNVSDLKSGIGMEGAGVGESDN